MNFSLRPKPHASNPESGYVILMGVLIMGAVAASIATSVLLIGVGSSQSSLVQQQAYQAQSLANACAEIAIANLDADTEYAGETIDPLGTGTCIISIVQPCPSSVCTIEATGSVGSVTRKTRVTATVGSGGGGLLLGKGVFPDSGVLSYVVTGVTGTINVRDNASTPNQPANEPLEIAAGATTPIIRTTDNRVNVGDVVTLNGDGFTLSNALNDLNCNCVLVPITYCATLTFNSSPAGQCNYTGTTGNFSGCSFTVPAAPYGKQNLTGTDKGNFNATAIPPACQNQRTSLNQTFFVEPKITATSPCTGNPKTTIINGTGFAASSTVTITWNDADTTITRNTSATGSFTSTVSFTPPLTTGTHTIGAHDSVRNFAPNITSPCS